MAIRRRTHHGFGPILPPARSVVDEELLAETLRQPLPYHTRDDVKLAAGGCADNAPALISIDGSSPRCIHCQHLAYIGLRYAKLSRNQ